MPSLPPSMLIVRTICQYSNAKHAFCCSAPATWNSLPRTVADSDSLGTFTSRLKTFMFSLAFNRYWHYQLPQPLKLRPIQIYYYYYYYYLLLLLLFLICHNMQHTPSMFQFRLQCNIFTLFFCNAGFQAICGHLCVEPSFPAYFLVLDELLKLWTAHNHTANCNIPTNMSFVQ